MAEESELVGGISVSLGASDAKLAGDLAAANRIVEEQWVNKTFNAQLRVGLAGGTGAPGGGGRQAAPQPPSRPVFGAAAVQTQVAAQQGQTALQRRINEELAKTGEIYNTQTGEIERTTAALSTQRAAVVSTARVSRQALTDEEVRHVQMLARVDQAERAQTTRTQASRAARIAPAGDEEEQQGLANSVRFSGRDMRFREQHEDRIARLRARAGTQAYNAQEVLRRRELNRTQQHFTNLTTLATKYFDEQERRAGGGEVATVTAESQQRLQSLSYENQRAGSNIPMGGGFAPQRTPAQIAAYRASEQARANAAASRSLVRPTTLIAPAQGPVDEIERARRRAMAEVEARGRGRGGGATMSAFRQSDEEIERRERTRVAGAEAQRLAAGRTARTSAAGFGGMFLFGGPARQQVEASAAVAAADQKVLAARKRLSDPEIIRSPRAYRAATEEVTVALKQQAAATERLQSLGTGGTALRSLAAVTVAGAAFGLAMSAASTGLKLVEQAVGPTLERLTGFASTTAAYTDSLADATRAASGNAQAVTALKLASTGMSAVTAASIQPLIQQRAEIEAGNKAIQDQIESFNVSENLRKQGGNAGLGSTTGGFLGTGLGGIPSTGEQIGNLLRQRGDEARNPRATAVPGTGFLPGILTPRYTSQPGSQADAVAAFGRALSGVNESLVKGGDAADQLTRGTAANADQVQRTARAFDVLSPAMAAAIRENNLYSDSLRTEADAKRALEAINYAATLPDPALLAQQFNRQNPAIIAAANRQQAYAIGAQLPAQQALQNLAAPLKPIGTGYLARDAVEAAKIKGTQAESQGLQDGLNARYKQGEQILRDTYHLTTDQVEQLRASGSAIATLQAGISNATATYQVHQYNLQLFLARRTLQDINGLTGRNFGGAGQTRLGELEKENLALSRQGQLLQFNLSQRQISFQVAQAGFAAPGLTSEERAARINEAKYEASFAQKSLDIQKQMFGNQVQIVDISNLRQGQDLLKQIGLLTEGRALTLKVQVDTEKINLEVTRQQQQLADIGTQISKMDSLFATANGEIQQLELAAGNAIGSVANTILSQFGLALGGMGAQLDAWTKLRGRATEGTGPTSKSGAASGVLGRTHGTTDITVGEAGGEEVAVLSHPRAYLGGMGGGGAVSVTFNGGITVRSESDIDTIVRRVESAINSRAGLIMRTG